MSGERFRSGSGLFTWRVYMKDLSYITGSPAETGTVNLQSGSQFLQVRSLFCAQYVMTAFQSVCTSQFISSDLI